MKLNKPVKSNGFTLIETMVVIAIIILLAVITIQVTSRLLQNSKNSVSISNLRSIGVGLQIVVSENNGTYPYGIANYYAKTWWDDVAATQGRSTSWGEKAGEAMQSPLRSIKRKGGYPTYGGNPFILVDGPNGARVPPLATQIKRPEQVIIVTDATQKGSEGDWGEAADMVLYGIPGLDWGQNSARAEGAIGTGNNTDTGLASIRYRSKDHANCLFVDGAVRAMKRGTILQKNFAIEY